jgi:hypothetical protein
MHNKPWFYPAWALLSFWFLALHTATGMLNNLIAAHSGKRSAIIGFLNAVIEGFLVVPLGRPLAVIVLVIAGAAIAYWMYPKQREKI